MLEFGAEGIRYRVSGRFLYQGAVDISPPNTENHLDNSKPKAMGTGIKGWIVNIKASGFCWILGT